jgi:hypothetical protein
MNLHRVLVLCLTLTIAALPAVAGETITLSESEFDFGFAPQNAKISHIFRITAPDRDSLKITEVVPGCGCTKAPLDKSELGPGESTNLEIVFDSRSYRGAVRKGPRFQAAGSTEPTKLTIIANITTRPDSTYPVIIKPYKVDISQFGEQTRDQMTFSISNVSDADLHPTLVSVDENAFTVTLPATIRAGETAEGVVQLTAKALTESFEKSFTFSLSDGSSTRFTVPVKRTVKSPTTTAAVK